LQEETVAVVCSIVVYSTEDTKKERMDKKEKENVTTILCLVSVEESSEDLIRALRETETDTDRFSLNRKPTDRSV
jgi:hypothetical protein